MYQITLEDTVRVSVNQILTYFTQDHVDNTFHKISEKILNFP